MNEKVYDYKKEYKDLYLPKDKPVLVEVPAMKFATVDTVLRHPVERN